MRTSIELLGVSQAIQELIDEIKRIAQCDAKVLVTGESGVGKDLVSQLIHQNSSAAPGPFVAEETRLPHLTALASSAPEAENRPIGRTSTAGCFFLDLHQL